MDTKTGRIVELVGPRGQAVAMAPNGNVVRSETLIEVPKPSNPAEPIKGLRTLEGLDRRKAVKMLKRMPGARPIRLHELLKDTGFAATEERARQGLRIVRTLATRKALEYVDSKNVRRGPRFNEVRATLRGALLPEESEKALR